MWHMKVLAVSVVVLGSLLFGAAIAFAGWGWNAKVNIDGTMISTSWAVDDVTGARDYHAEVKVSVHSDTDARVVKVAPTENVRIEYVATCTEEGVTYKVTGVGNALVSVSVDRVGGGGKHNYGYDSGGLGQTMFVNVPLSGACNG